MLCVDEKSQVQTGPDADRAEPILSLRRSAARQSYAYQRHGVTSFFAEMDVASGATISKCYRHQDHAEDHNRKERGRGRLLIDQSTLTALGCTKTLEESRESAMAGSREVQLRELPRRALIPNRRGSLSATDKGS